MLDKKLAENWPKESLAFQKESLAFQKGSLAFQNKIYQKMSPKKKLEIASQLILLAKKLRESKEVIKEPKKK